MNTEAWTGQLRTKWPFLAALGAGCLVGASGLILIQRLSNRCEAAASARGHEANSGLSKELTSLHLTIRDLREAIRELKEGQSGRPLRSALRTVTFADVNRSLEAKLEDPSMSQDPGAISSPSDTYLTPVSSSSALSPSANTSEFYSAISSEEGEEYFDLKEDEDLAGLEIQPQILHGSDVVLELFRIVDDLCTGTEDDQADALKLLKEQEEDLHENSEFLWRLCKATYLSSTAAGIAGDVDKKRELIFESVQQGKRALDCSEEVSFLNGDTCQNSIDKSEREAIKGSSEAHKWYAIAVGSRGEFLGIKEKILDGFEFKKHVDIAAKLAPDDHTIQHLLGRFCYEVAELSWFERKMATTLFTEPPLATMEEARDHFLKAEKIKAEGWKENRLFLAKSLIKMQCSEEAMTWLDKAADLPSNNQDDRQAHDEILQLLEEYNATPT